MTYDEKELEKKLKTAKNFWSFAYAKYVKQKEQEAQEAWDKAYRDLVEAFSPKEEKRLENAKAVLQAATQLHEVIKTINDEKMLTRKELEKLEAESIDARAEKIRNGIADYCEKFTANHDRTLIAAEGSCLLEYLDAMNDSPELAAKVGLTDAQMTAASKIVSMAMIIKEGMEALEQEYADSTQPEPSLTSEQRAMNLTKITCMDCINEKRFDGNLLKELQACKLIRKQAAEDRLNTAAELANPEKRRRITKAFIDSVNKPVKQLNN